MQDLALPEFRHFGRMKKIDGTDKRHDQNGF